MAWMHEGSLEGEGLRIAIVVSRFNGFITERLVEGLSTAWNAMA